MPSEAVHDQPSATLPLPPWGKSGIVRKIIVHAKRAPHHKQTVRDFMEWTHSVFLEAAIEKQAADL